MSAKVEKKFRVGSFDNVERRLRELGREPARATVATHYYAQDTLPIVRKIVQDDEGVRITELVDHNGTFEFTKRESVDSLEAGLQWMHEQGHKQLTKLKMQSTVYDYEDGEVECIVIDDGKIKSIILYYEPPKHEEIARTLGLEAAQKIETPFSELV